MGKTNFIKNRETRELVMERVFDASQETVWDAWTDPEKLARWWGPRGWETTIKTFDFRPSGVWHYCMKCIDENQGEFYGQESWGKAVFGEINQPNSLTYTDYFSDPEGNANHELPSSLIEMTLTQEDGKTKVTSRTVFETAEAYDQVIAMGIEQGAAETWDRLAEFVESAK